MIKNGKDNNNSSKFFKVLGGLVEGFENDGSVLIYPNKFKIELILYDYD